MSKTSSHVPGPDWTGKGPWTGKDVGCGCLGRNGDWQVQEMEIWAEKGVDVEKEVEISAEEGAGCGKGEGNLGRRRSWM
eukprot:615908-Rhodomonas_salina.3